MDIKMGYYTADGSATSVVLGFVPDWLEVHNLTKLTTFYWNKAAHDAALPTKFGIVEFGTSAMIEGDAAASAIGQNASGCTLASCATALVGISALDKMDEYGMVDSPVPGKGKVPAKLYHWTPGSAMTASRTTSIPGGLIIPTQNAAYSGAHSAMGLCYEQLLAGTTSATEPAWSTVVGGDNIDNDISCVCRNLEVVRSGGKGFIVGATIQANSDVIHFTAFKSDQDKYIGDAADTGCVSMV